MINLSSIGSSSTTSPSPVTYGFLAQYKPTVSIGYNINTPISYEYFKLFSFSVRSYASLFVEIYNLAGGRLCGPYVTLMLSFGYMSYNFTYNILMNSQKSNDTYANKHIFDKVLISNGRSSHDVYLKVTNKTIINALDPTDDNEYLCLSYRVVDLVSTIDNYTIDFVDGKCKNVNVSDTYGYHIIDLQ